MPGGARRRIPKGEAEREHDRDRPRISATVIIAAPTPRDRRSRTPRDLQSPRSGLSDTARRPRQPSEQSRPRQESKTWRSHCTGCGANARPGRTPAEEPVIPAVQDDPLLDAVDPGPIRKFHQRRIGTPRSREECRKAAITATGNEQPVLDGAETERARCSLEPYRVLFPQGAQHAEPIHQRRRRGRRRRARNRPVAPTTIGSNALKMWSRPPCPSSRARRSARA